MRCVPVERPRPEGGPSLRRRPPVAALLALAILVAGVEAPAAPPVDFGQNNPLVIVAFGDSITEGTLGDPPRDLADRPYPEALQGLLNARRPGFTVRNRGRGGEPTDGGAGRIDDVLATDRPGFVLIMEGTNDANGAADPDDVVANLRRMVQLAKANHTVPILGTVLRHFSSPVAESVIEAVNARLPAVAAEEGVRFVNTFAAMNNAALFGADGFHPNQAGYDVLAAAWLSTLLDAIEPSLFRVLAGVDDPPDAVSPAASIATGPTRVVLARPSLVALRDKTGALLGARTPAAFFAPVLVPGETIVSDPQVTFDPGASRFFFVAGARNDDSLCVPGTCVAHELLAVSRTATPATLDASDWRFYALDRTRDVTPSGTTVSATWGDRDRVAVVGPVVVLASRTRRFGDDAPQGVKVRLVAKSAVVAEAAVTTWVDLVDFGPQAATGLLPATTFGDPGTVFLVSRAGCGFRLHGIADSLGTPTVGTAVIGTAAAFCGAPGSAAQPGGPPIDLAAAGFATQPVYRNGSLWVADTVGVPAASGGTSVIRWLQVDVAAWPAGVTVVQDAFFGAEDVSHFAPAIAVDATSNLSMVYGRSGATEFASTWVTGRRATDLPGTLRPGLAVAGGVTALSLADSTGQQGFGSLGAAVDPADGSAWLIGLHAEAPQRIGSRVTQLGLAASPTLGVALERDTFRAGQTLRLTAALTPAGVPVLVDAYVVVRMPDGSFLSLLEDGRLVPGLSPIRTGFEPFAFSGEILRVVLTGAEPPGDYAWLAALTRPGTRAAIGVTDLAPFQVQ